MRDKLVNGFGKKSCVSTSVRKAGNICVTDVHDMTLAVKVALNPNTTNHHPSSEGKNNKCQLLTLSLTTNFRPFQTERVCRRQFKI